MIPKTIPKKLNKQKFIFAINLTVILLIFLIILIALSRILNINIDVVTEQIKSAGIFGPIFFILLMALAIVISPIPSLPLTVSSGVIWGPILGTTYSVIGAIIGASISFLIARRFGRKFIHKLLGDYAIFCDQCTKKSLFFIILISRIFPFFQFDVISYGAGLTAISFWKFVIASIMGMIPTTYLFVRFGLAVAINSWISITLSAVLIISIFIVPRLFEKRFKKYIGGGA